MEAMKQLFCILLFVHPRICSVFSRKGNFLNMGKYSITLKADIFTYPDDELRCLLFPVLNIVLAERNS